MSADNKEKEPVLVSRTTGEIIVELHKRGFTLYLENNELRYAINREVLQDEKECIQGNESDFVDLLKIAGWPFIWRWASFTTALQTNAKSFAASWINIKPEKDKCAICDEPLGSEYEDYEYIDRKYCAACSLAGAEMIDSLLKFAGMMVSETKKELLQDNEGSAEDSEGPIN